jgi:hypothetical protein
VEETITILVLLGGIQHVIFFWIIFEHVQKQIKDCKISYKMILATGQEFSPCTSVSSTNKTDQHDIAEILWKVALNIIKQTSIS